MTRPTLATLSDPLAQHFLDPEFSGIGGVIKQRVEDFLVSEIPLYETCGEGEHIYLRLRKTGVSHAEMMATVRNAFRVPEKAIGYAGMKDKQGVTEQTISVHMHEDPPRIDLGHTRIEVLDATRHTNKLRMGHLKGNRFSIRIREVDPFKAPLVLKQLRMLEYKGMPNYFGPQRFGYRRNNHVIGSLVLNQDWTGMLDELLGSNGSPFPEYQAPRRGLYDEGHYREAMSQWAKADRAELAALRALTQGASPDDACQRMGRTMLSFYANAFQSAAFNRVLDGRLERGTLDRLEEGDLAWKHDSRSVFGVTQDELASGELEPRLEKLEISPSGPLWGKGMTRAGGGVDEREVIAIASLGMEVKSLLESPRVPKGARRPMRETLTNSSLESGVDEHGGYIQVAFDLPRGVYATVVLRELMKNDGEGQRNHVDDRA
ncbi:MAG: tRNA pseudouridine(13) synthase TruD [Planctomycetota bacterium]|nr:tRNA pseudouridine(13) synthase TruD [Planctomycetota bacterium]